MKSLELELTDFSSHKKAFEVADSAIEKNKAQFPQEKEPYEHPANTGDVYLDKFYYVVKGPKNHEYKSSEQKRISGKGELKDEKMLRNLESEGLAIELFGMPSGSTALPAGQTVKIESILYLQLQKKMDTAKSLSIHRRHPSLLLGGLDPSYMHNICLFLHRRHPPLRRVPPSYMHNICT